MLVASAIPTDCAGAPEYVPLEVESEPATDSSSHHEAVSQYPLTAGRGVGLCAWTRWTRRTRPSARRVAAIETIRPLV